ncbi:hypothetical protein DFH27DRAFT_522097 [Peziza echinospora]|nr:hypothetical protein DFH27DRAFT_522097 [Peziza echinospora]
MYQALFVFYGISQLQCQQSQVENMKIRILMVPDNLQALTNCSRFQPIAAKLESLVPRILYRPDVPEGEISNTCSSSHIEKEDERLQLGNVYVTSRIKYSSRTHIPRIRLTCISTVAAVEI